MPFPLPSNPHVSQYSMVGPAFYVLANAQMTRAATWYDDALYQEFYSTDGWVTALWKAFGVELDQLDTALLYIRDEALPNTARYQLAMHEWLVGIPTNENLPVRRRQSVLTAFWNARQIQTDAQFQAFVQALLDGSAPPTLCVIPRQVVTFIPSDRGWPGVGPAGADWFPNQDPDGTVTFGLVQNLLRRAGSLCQGWWLAPWDDINGLVDGQLDLMDGRAIDCLTDVQLDGQVVTELELDELTDEEFDSLADAILDTWVDEQDVLTDTFLDTLSDVRFDRLTDEETDQTSVYGPLMRGELTWAQVDALNLTWRDIDRLGLLWQR